jgi:hypothetical protein
MITYSDINPAIRLFPLEYTVTCPPFEIAPSERSSLITELARIDGPRYQYHALVSDEVYPVNIQQSPHKK